MVRESLSKRKPPAWADDFRIQSTVDLDFVIGQDYGNPVGMLRRSPAEFRRRVLAAAVSYQLHLSSIDYARKRYVESNVYDDEEISLADSTSDYIRDSVTIFSRELRSLHTAYPSFGVLGAELTLYKVPHSLDVARMLANRGLLLEVMPILRLCLEMLAWANVAFYMEEEAKVIDLKAQSCISKLKSIYENAGNIYGYLSRFSHWGHVIHGQFIDIDEHVSIVNASVRYRAMALALCLVILDVFIEVVRKIYAERSNSLVVEIQGGLDQGPSRRLYHLMSSIVERTELDDVREIQSLLR